MTIGVGDREHSGQVWTLLAFEAACQRAEGHTEVGYASWAATAEAMFWACAADEGYMELLGDEYTAARDQDPSGVQLNGVRWARNRMTHQRAIVIAQHYGTMLDTWILDVGVLGTADHLKWGSSEDVPLGRHDQGRDVYDTRLAGRSVRRTVDACRSWLFGMPMNELSTRAGYAIGDLPGIPRIGG